MCLFIYFVLLFISENTDGVEDFVQKLCSFFFEELQFHLLVTLNESFFSILKSLFDIWEILSTD